MSTWLKRLSQLNHVAADLACAWVESLAASRICLSRASFKSATKTLTVLPTPEPWLTWTSKARMDNLTLPPDACTSRVLPQPKVALKVASQNHLTTSWKRWERSIGGKEVRDVSSSWPAKTSFQLLPRRGHETNRSSYPVSGIVDNELKEFETTSLWISSFFVLFEDQSFVQSACMMDHFRFIRSKYTCWSLVFYQTCSKTTSSSVSGRMDGSTLVDLTHGRKVRSSWLLMISLPYSTISHLINATAHHQFTCSTLWNIQACLALLFESSL